MTFKFEQIKRFRLSLEYRPNGTKFSVLLTSVIYHGVCNHTISKLYGFEDEAKGNKSKFFHIIFLITNKHE